MQGDGRVPSFYTWPDSIPETPGTMLRSEPLEPGLGLISAGRQIRLLYSSTDGVDGRTPIVVSAAYYEPKGEPPANGWPLIAWAHGPPASLTSAPRPYGHAICSRSSISMHGWRKALPLSRPTIRAWDARTASLYAGATGCLQRAR